jgi:hypothetical protein
MRRAHEDSEHRWRALSLTAPWTDCILELGKRVENRVWRTHFRGEFLLHAAKGCTREAYEACLDFVDDAFGDAVARKLPAFESLQRGGIVGRARLVDCRWNDTAPHDPWRMSCQYGFELENVERVPFAPCGGALGFWRVPDAVISALGLQPPAIDFAPEPKHDRERSPPRAQAELVPRVTKAQRLEQRLSEVKGGRW